MNGKLAYNFFFLFRADFLTGFVKGKRLKAIVGIRSDNTILFQNGISLLFERFRFLVQCPEPLFKVVCLLLYFVNFAAQTQNNLTILKHNVKIVQTNLTYNSTIVLLNLPVQFTAVCNNALGFHCTGCCTFVDGWNFI